MKWTSNSKPCNKADYYNLDSEQEIVVHHQYPNNGAIPPATFLPRQPGK